MGVEGDSGFGVGDREKRCRAVRGRPGYDV